MSKSMFDTEVFCPYCDKLVTVDAEGLYEDGAEAERECSNCDKTFNLIMNIAFTYDTEEIRND